MAFQVSPGVSVAEVDLTTRVPIPSISDGGYSGRFKWGPIHDVELVSSEDDLVDKFGKPDGTIFAGYISAANFLSYSNKLRVVRTANTSQAKNAVANGSAVLIQNDAKYSNTYESTTTSGTNWAAKWAGDLGNTFKTSICMATRANTEVSPDGVVTVASTSYVTMNGTFALSGTTVTSTTAADGDVDEELRVGDVITIAESSSSKVAIVTAIANSSQFTAVATGSGSDTGILAGSGSGKTVRRLKRSAFAEPAENMLGTIQASLGANTISGTNTKFQTQINSGDIVICTDAAGQTQRRKVTAVTSNTALSVDSAYSTSAVSASTTYSREWEFRSDFDAEPLTSTYAYDRTGKKDVNDEILKIAKIVNSQNLLLSAKTEHIYSEAIELFKRLGINDRYFNAGIMIINFQKWKEENVSEKLRTKVNQIRNNINYWDQDVLNSFVNGKFEELPLELNYTVDVSNAETNIPNEIKIIHYSGKSKPWDKKEKSSNFVSYYQELEQYFKI